MERKQTSVPVGPNGRRSRMTDANFRSLIRSARKYAGMADEAKEDGLVYFIAPIGGGPVKIGFTRNPGARFKQLQNTSPHPLELIACSPGGEEVEKLYHIAFQDARTHGEWFEPTYRLKCECEQLAERWIG